MKNKDKLYIGMADNLSLASTCLRRRYGAIIVNHDEVISTGYNGSPRGDTNCNDVGYCERERLNIPKGQRYELCVAVHAEQNAIISAQRDRMIGSTIYIVGHNVADNSYANGQPCLICVRMIINAGIEKVVYMNENGELIEETPFEILNRYKRELGQI